MRKWVAATIVVLGGGCRKAPEVYVEWHATASHLELRIEGAARHIDVVSCDDTTKQLWAFDAPSGGYLPGHVLVDSTALRDADCYVARLQPGGRRVFRIRSKGGAVQYL